MAESECLRWVFALTSLRQVLEEEILPALEKLRKERSAYMQWVASSENLDRLRRFCIAHEFTAAKQLQDDSESQMQSLQVRESQYQPIWPSHGAYAIPSTMCASRAMAS